MNNIKLPRLEIADSGQGNEDIPTGHLLPAKAPRRKGHQERRIEPQDHRGHREEELLSVVYIEGMDWMTGQKHNSCAQRRKDRKEEKKTGRRCFNPVFAEATTREAEF